MKTRGAKGPDFGDLDVAAVTSDDVATVMGAQPAEHRGETRIKMYNRLHRLFELAEFPCRLRPEGSNPVRKYLRPEVADRMGTSQSTVARLERGGAMPSLSTLRRFAQATARAFGSPWKSPRVNARREPRSASGAGKSVGSAGALSTWCSSANLGQ